MGKLIQTEKKRCKVEYSLSWWKSNAFLFDRKD